MSGTSLDGIDVAIIETNGRSLETVGFYSEPYPGEMFARLISCQGQLNWIKDISRAHWELGELYAAAVRKAVKRFGPVELIGCHGQTVYHEGGKHTLQLGEAAVIAERCGVPVVSNFRARDIAAGGQGAPLVPFADYLLFRDAKRTRIVLNIGGIANITVIPPKASIDDVVAFDTGPGNMVIDAIAFEASGGKQRFDRDGKLAASGSVNRALLGMLLRDEYYRRKPPKSAGREQYGRAFVERMNRSTLSFKNMAATATALTSTTIAEAVRRYQGKETDLIVSGGGVHNRLLMSQLIALLPGVNVSSSSDHGVDADGKEAIAFALLAYQTWKRRPGNVPRATGARRPVVLGDVTF
jgi:anhydro-N-acetylmuramic acid kinase